MREKKYANVLDKYDKEINDNSLDRVVESEEKFSMTRELKYKELQEELQKDYTTEIEVEDTVDMDNFDEDEESEESRIEETEEDKRIASRLNNNRNEKTEEIEIKREASKGQIRDDDIYLTTSFKPPKLSFRLKKGVKGLLYFLIFFSLIGMLVFFVGLPAYNKYMDSKPKRIFDGTIDYISNKLVDVVENIYSNDDILAGNASFKLKSNLEELEDINGNDLGLEIGIDSKNKIYETKIYTEDMDQKYSFNYLYNGSNYYHYSTLDKYIELKNSDISKEYYGYLNDYLDGLSKVDKNDLVYFIETEQEIFKELLESNLIKSENDELDIGGKTFKVTKNSFEIDEKNYERLYKKRNEKVLNDKILLRVEATLAQMSTEEYGKLLNKELKKYHKITINIYTVSGNKVIGFDIEKDGFRNVFYYSNDGKFKFHFNLASKIVIGNDKNNSQKVLDLVGENKNNQINVDIKYNTKDVAHLKIQEFNKEKIEFEYEAEIKKNKYLGNSLFSINTDKKEANIDFSIKYDKKFINLNVNIASNYDFKFDNISKSNVIKYTDKIYNDERFKFIDSLPKEMKEGFNYWDKLLSNPLYLNSEIDKILTEALVSN